MTSSALPCSTDLDLRPFRALRYDPARVGQLSDVICPPYDTMSPSRVRALSLRPHHFSRLLYADDPVLAASQMERWMRRGVLRRDENPAIYVYEQRQGRRVLQCGVIGELRLPTNPTDRLLPHEGVRPHEVGKRAALMSGLGAQMEPLLVACRATEPVFPLAGVLDRMVRSEPAADARVGRITHRLWACTEPVQQRVIAQGIAGCRALIADGHHRHAALRRLNSEASHGTWGGALALLVDTSRHPMRLTAIHRVLPGLVPEKVALAVSQVATVRRLPSGPRAPRGDEVVLTGGGAAWTVTGFDESALLEALAGHPAQWRPLPVAAVDRLLIDAALSIPDKPDAVRHEHSLDRSVAAVSAPGSGAAFLLPPVTETVVRELAAQGVLLPRKTTAFGPKPAAGFVMRT